VPAALPSRPTGRLDPRLQTAAARTAATAVARLAGVVTDAGDKGSGADVDRGAGR
jgi:hypothetical protein